MSHILTAEDAAVIIEKIHQQTPAATPPAAAIPAAVGFTRDRLDKFIQLCQSGQSVAQALKESALVEPTDAATYIPGVDDEAAIEELFYARARAKKPPMLTDDQYQAFSPEERAAQNKAGAISTTQFHKLVDWLYFQRSLPLKSIAVSLQVPLTEVVAVKAAISNDFSKSLKAQHAEAYIGDLLRVKELLRADIAMRKSRHTVTDRMHAVYDRIIWEMENKFIDRLQEIGYIDKTLGRLDVHEEWEVTIGAAGQPVNSKLRSISQFDDDREREQGMISSAAGNKEIIDIAASPVDSYPAVAGQQVCDPSQPGTLDDRGAARTEAKPDIESATITVGSEI